jgi:predicted nuclease of predicted toxin-antitoxin system
MTKFLVDVGVGRKVEGFLRKSGYDVKAVRDVNSRARDTDILKLAVSEGRMIITMDKDFGELVYNSGMAHSGVLILRLEDAKGTDKADVVAKLLSDYSGEIENKFCVFQDGKLRIRGKSK